MNSELAKEIPGEELGWELKGSTRLNAVVGFILAAWFIMFGLVGEPNWYLILVGGLLGVIGACYLLKDPKEGRFDPILYLPKGEGVAGAELVGEIRLHTPLPTDAKVQLSLSCNHFEYNGDEMPRKEVLWKRTKETLSDRGTSIIVSFDLAEVCIESKTNPETSQAIEWHLDACAVNTKFKVRFVVPIAKQTDSESDDLRRQ